MKTPVDGGIIFRLLNHNEYDFRDVLQPKPLDSNQFHVVNESVNFIIVRENSLNLRSPCAVHRLIIDPHSGNTIQSIRHRVIILKSARVEVSTLKRSTSFSGRGHTRAIEAS